MEGKYDLDRFKKAQKDYMEDVVEELKNEHKTTHWIWFIFPQLKGLGYSRNSLYYGIDSVEEAQAYIEDEELRDNLFLCCNLLLDSKSNDIISIVGDIDARKIKSCMKLFGSVSDDDIFLKVLDKFYKNTYPHNRTKI